MLNLKLLSGMFSRSKPAADERGTESAGLEETVPHEIDQLRQSDLRRVPAEPYQTTIPMGLSKR